MTANELLRRYEMAAHWENGSYLERHYEHLSGGRAASGSIYYYVSPEERTAFHQIDCDEYWCYTEGSPLEVWLVDERGALTVQRLGTEDGCEPLIYVRQGVIFASRHSGTPSDGTFLTCITVPRFDAEGFRMLTEAEVVSLCPDAAAFFA